uniref:Uncharacterized protein n=1 Tax=Candidatus Methanophagaceae archaeon ANME-1 ERB6 TaxID=2759912 RepID=A0A7G9Z046_9EURY|nr:hypothetical protein NGENPBHE_00030 [Methanosarcinales archaeon ANME-1 ERB6]
MNNALSNVMGERLDLGIPVEQYTSYRASMMEIEELKEKIAELERENAELKKQNVELTKIIKDLKAKLARCPLHSSFSPLFTIPA